MTMPRPRFSLRTLLVVVTVCAVGCAAAIAQINRAARLRQLADQHGVEVWNNACIIQKKRRYRVDPRLAIEYHRAMEEKYREQIWHPWVALSSDPPKPD